MSDIRFGLTFYPHHSVDSPPHLLAEVAVQHARLAEDAGFHSLWTGHHYLTDDQTLQPIPLLARLAGEVARIELGAWFLLSMANPVDFAEQLASLDAITNGRLLCGAVMGYRDVEFNSLGIPKSLRASRLEEGIAVLNALWTRDNVAFEGRYVKLDGVTIHPKPVRKPRPPIWIGGNSDPAIKRAARIGDAWAIGPYATMPDLIEQVRIYNQALSEEGKNPSNVVRPLLREAFVAASRTEAWSEAGRYIAPFYETYVKWGKEEAMGQRGDLSRPFRELANDRFLIGEPSFIVDEIQRYTETIGVNYFIFQINRPGMPLPLILKNVELLGEYVLPHFR